MNDLSTFSEFSRQSSKGILVIYGNLLVKVFKVTWILLFFFVRKVPEMSNEHLFYSYTGILGLLIFLLVRAYLLYKNFQFKIEGDQFVLKQGILSKTNTSISFDRIQNINFKQNLIQQFINVYEVSIETAGSNNTEIAIKALSFEKAQALKHQISHTQGKEIIKDLQEEKPLLKIGVFELLKVSITENHLQSLLLLMALLLGLFQQVQQVAESFGSEELIDSYVDQGTNVLLGNIILFVILIALLIVGAIISSFIRVFLRHFNLTMLVKKAAFEIHQGLLTKKAIILKNQKIQSITISTNPIKRAIGISFITFKQAVSGKVEHKKKDKLIRIVGCKEQQVSEVKKLLFDTKELEGIPRENPDSFYKTRMLFQSTLLLFIINGLLFLGFHSFSVFYVDILLIPLFLFLIQKKFKKRFFKITADLLLVGRGLVETHHTFFELFKVQNIKMKQTIFQERRNVADLVLQTASGKIIIPCVKMNRATEIYNYLLYKVETSTESWM